MRYLLSSVAIIATLAMPTLASAQRTSPGPYANTGSGPGVIPPGGYGPSSPMFNLPAGSAGLSRPASWWTAPGSAATPPFPSTTPRVVYPQSQ